MLKMGLVSINQLAFSGVVSLISFLAYGSQCFFRYTDPGRLEHNQSVVFNLLVAFIWLCYARACFTDPGHVPRKADNDSVTRTGNMQRWCKKCEHFKPPRAHHCKVCRR